jgi:hypothetical protein
MDNTFNPMANINSPIQFASIDNNHCIEISIIEDTCYFNIVRLIPEFYKTFLILLKKVIEYMSNNKIKYIKQYIVEEDKELFKKSIFLEKNNILVVKTDIENFIEEICDAIGIQRL